MSVVKLGTKLKVSYEAQNQKTGLIDITLKIEKPDGTFLGPFPMVETSDIGFYRYEVLTNINDDEGDYIGIINSPSEFKEKTHIKFTMLNTGSGDDIGSGTVILTRGFIVGELSSNKLKGQISNSTLNGKIISSDTLSAVIIKPSILIGSISNKFLTSYIMEKKNG